MNVDRRFEEFLKTLPGKTIKLNDMRTMRPNKHEELREILRKHMADPVL